MRGDLIRTLEKQIQEEEKGGGLPSEGERGGRWKRAGACWRREVEDMVGGSGSWSCSEINSGPCAR